MSIRLEVESGGDREDDKVEDSGADGLGYENALESKWITRAEAPATRVFEGKIPVGSNRVARKPAQYDKGGAPCDGDDDHAFAKDRVPGPSLEDTKVLEQ